MKIDLNNYEAFFLDFVEGRLDNSSTLEMLAFLRRHPELKQELENFSDVKLAPYEIEFKEKDSLKRLYFSNTLVNLKNFDEFSIAYYEKLLTSEENDKLLTFLKQHPEKNNDFKQFGKIYLKPDESIVFEAKRFLKRKPKGAVRSVVLRWTAVAAGIVLAVSVFYKTPVEDKKTSPKTNVASLVKNIDEQRKIPPAVAAKQKNGIQKQNIVTSQKVATKVITSKQQELQQETETVEEDLNLIDPINIASIQGGEEYTRPDITIPTSAAVKPRPEAEETELLDYAQNLLMEKVLKKGESEKHRKKITLWDIAEITLKGYNHISEKNITLKRETDENGKLTAIAIETENKKYGFETKN